MADHCRKQIRDALAAYLRANLSTPASVLTDRVHPIEGDNLPALLIFTNEESTDMVNKAGTRTRSLLVALEAHAQTAEITAALDAIAAEVEASFAAALPAWVKGYDLNMTSVELSGVPVPQSPSGVQAS